MKITGEIMHSSEDKEEGTPTLVRQFIFCVLNLYTTDSSADGTEKSKPRFVRYPPQAITSVTWLSVAQILCGLVMLGSQVLPIYWTNLMKALLHVEVLFKFADIYGGGIWCGLVIFVTGVIGLVASRKNVKAMILTHLIMNLFALACSITLFVLAAMSIGTLADCKLNGTSFYISSHHVPADVSIYGENISMVKHFYCVHEMFTIWIVLEAVMIAAAVATLFTSVWLFVKNSMAACLCCQQCCTPESVMSEDDEEVLVSA